MTERALMLPEELVAHIEQTAIQEGTTVDALIAAKFGIDTQPAPSRKSSLAQAMEQYHAVLEVEDVEWSEEFTDLSTRGRQIYQEERYQDYMKHQQTDEDKT